jgi:NAD(P)H-dependent FMN reductase
MDEKTMPKLKIIVTTTRQGRKGRAIADWFHHKAVAKGGWDVDLVDLKEIGLPPMDEPNHPNQKKYVHDHTRAWSRIVDEADAFVFVVPEYNHGMPPAMLNALDYLYQEWTYKAAGFVSYGGISGGTRSVQMCRLVLPGLRMMPVPEAVTLPFFGRSMTPEGQFDPGDIADVSVATMLDELAKWTAALMTLRGKTEHG